jgi:hypothetical protein
MKLLAQILSPTPNPKARRQTDKTRSLRRGAFIDEIPIERSQMKRLPDQRESLLSTTTRYRDKLDKIIPCAVESCT